MTQPDPSAILEKRPRGRFFFLLVTLILYIFVVPAIENLIHIKFLLDLFFSLVLISAIYTVSLRIQGFIIGIFLAAPMLISVWLTYLVKVEAVILVAHIFAVFFMLYTIAVILRFIIRRKTITTNIIYASIAVYLLIGITWALIYSLGHDLDPNSFTSGDIAFGQEMVFFSYYSFITLTTLGYGDVTPIAPWATSLSALEAVVGQFYIAVLVAKLVGMHIAQSLGSSDR